MSHARTFPVVLFSDEDGAVVAHCPILPGCSSQGATRDEALANIREAIELTLESRHREGWEPPATYELTDVAVNMDADGASDADEDNPEFQKPEGMGFLEWLHSRPYDDEPTTPAQNARAAEAIAEIERGEALTVDPVALAAFLAEGRPALPGEVWHELGL